MTFKTVVKYWQDAALQMETVIHDDIEQAKLYAASVKEKIDEVEIKIYDELEQLVEMVSSTTVPDTYA